MNSKQKKAMIIIFLAVVVSFSWLIVEVKYLDNINQNTQLCEDYANQQVTSSRVHVEGGEREYSINGEWVKESNLIRSCKE